MFSSVNTMHEETERKKTVTEDKTQEEGEIETDREVSYKGDVSSFSVYHQKEDSIWDPNMPY